MKTGFCLIVTIGLVCAGFLACGDDSTSTQQPKAIEPAPTAVPTTAPTVAPEPTATAVPTPEPTARRLPLRLHPPRQRPYRSLRRW